MRHLKRLAGPTILGSMLYISPLALANPVLMHAPEGVRVDTTSKPNTTIIHQTTPSAKIDWHSHDIAAHETTHYQQPPGGIALSRIHSGQPTQIYGKLTATGKVILVNGAGIHFGPGSYVNVGGLVASTLDISDANFNAGRYVFDKPGRPNAKIINQGHIQAEKHGLVALVGPHIENHGLIEAQLGTVALGAGDKVTMGFGDNDQLIHFVVEDEVLDSKHPQVKKAIENEGRIMVEAPHARQVLDRVINMDGVQQATHVTQHNGVLIFHAGPVNQIRTREKRKSVSSPRSSSSYVIVSSNPRRNSQALSDSWSDAFTNVSEEKQTGLAYSQGYLNRPRVDGYVVPTEPKALSESKIINQYEMLQHPLQVYEGQPLEEYKEVKHEPVSLRELVRQVLGDENPVYLSSLTLSPRLYQGKDPLCIIQEEEG